MLSCAQSAVPRAAEPLGSSAAAGGSASVASGFYMHCVRPVHAVALPPSGGDHVDVARNVVLYVAAPTVVLLLIVEVVAVPNSLQISVRIQVLPLVLLLLVLFHFVAVVHGTSSPLSVGI
jgi:hypothetical protein